MEKIITFEDVLKGGTLDPKHFCRANGKLAYVPRGRFANEAYRDGRGVFAVSAQSFEVIADDGNYCISKHEVKPIEPTDKWEDFEEKTRVVIYFNENENMLANGTISQRMDLLTAVSIVTPFFTENEAVKKLSAKELFDYLMSKCS